jgi:glycosyltransferase involved in cell wall biosynthesis
VEPLVGEEISARRQPIRILLVDHADFLGGAERSALELLKSVDPVRYQITIACAPGGMMDVARAAGAPTVTLDLPQLRGTRNVLTAPGRFAAGVSGLVRLIRNQRIQIVHSNTMRAAIYASNAARLAGTKFLWHVRDLHRSRTFVWSMALAAHAIIANSRAVARTIPSFARQKTTVVYNGISLSDFDRASADGLAFRAELGVAASDVLVGTIGWLAPWKGHRAFMAAAAGIATQCARARFVIVGAASDSRYHTYEQELHALGERLLGSKLIWAGERNPMPPVLAGFDLMLHCAEREPFGRVLIEAMAMQVPVIAFGGAGPGEIIAHGETGVLVPTGDTGSMAAAAVRLLGDPAARAAMGQAARERAKALFDSATIAWQFEHVYDSLVVAR